MILMHVSSEAKALAVEKVASELGETIQKVSSEDLPRSILSIFTGKFEGGPKEKEAAKAKIPVLYAMPEVLVFVAFSMEKLDDFLSLYRKTGEEPVKLKAVTTPTNIQWTLYDLIEELKKEHASMNQ